MKNIFYIAVLSLGMTTSALASNSLGTINPKLSGKIKIEKLNKLKGLCTGSAVVLTAAGKQETITMDSFDAEVSTDCSDKFLSWLKGVAAKYPKIVSSSSNYNEYE